MSILTPELKAKWVEALRSGKYEQGTTSLKSSRGTWCCLGVLADIIDPDGWSVPARNALVGIVATADGRIYFGYNHPLAVNQYLKAEVGLGNIQDLREGSATQTKLANMNDSGCFNFNEIADYIEKNIDVA